MNKPTRSVKPLPVAPPVYRPQAVPKVLQKKTAENHRIENTQARSKPVAPPVYSPLPAPKVLQTKQSATQKPGPVIQPMMLGSCRLTVHRKHQSATGLRGVIQQTPLKITVNSNVRGKHNIEIEVDDDGKITGAELRRQVIETHLPQLQNRSQYIRLGIGSATVADDNTRYSLTQFQAITLHYDDQRAASDNRDAEPVDESLIDLASSANHCVIACFLLGKPGNREELDKQQRLSAVLGAIRARKNLRVVLIDPNFGDHSLNGQIVEYLETNEKVKFSQTSVSSDITTYTVREYDGMPVGATIQILYVAKSVNRPTTNVMRERRIGGWYSD